MTLLYYKFFIIIISCISLSASEMAVIPSRQSQYALIIQNARKINNERCFLEAVKNNNVSEVKHYIQNEHVNINAQDRDGHPALHLAAWKNHVEITQFLIDNNADVNIKDDKGRTALHITAYKNYIEIAKILLANNAEVNIQDNDGLTPLHEVITEAKSSKFLQLLIDYNADQLMPNRKGHCPDSYLALTCRGGTPTEGLDKAKNKFVVTSHAKLLRKRLELELIIDRSSLNAQLWDAARGNDIQKLRNLLKNKGADVNYQDIWFKDTALHTAAFYGRLEAIELLLQRKANPNIKNKAGKTALDVAIERPYLYIVNILLRHGADFTSTDKYLHKLIRQGESPGEPLIETSTSKERRKKFLSGHAILLSARLQQLVENNNPSALEKTLEKDKTIVLKKEVLPSTRNS